MLIPVYDCGVQDIYSHVDYSLECNYRPEVDILKNKLIALLGVTLVVGILAGFVVAPRMMWGGGSSGSVASWLIHVEADTLVAGSDRIVVAKYVDDRTETISKGAASDGVSKGSVNERFRKFTVVEVLKGSGGAGAEIYLVTTDSSTFNFGGGKSKDSSYELLELTEGTNYVLFLEGISRPEGYSSEYGDVLWASPGEPYLAQVDADGRWTFLATDVYENLVSEGGLTPVRGSAAPFELTKQQIKDLVAG